MPYPEDSDVSAFLQQILPDLTEEQADAMAEGYAAAAIRDFENMTGHKPFLAAEEPSDRFFDPPGVFSDSSPGFGYWSGMDRVLEADSFVDSSTVEVAIGVSPDNLVGTVLVVGDDVYVMPYNAAERGEPFTQVDFRYPRSGRTRSIKITARWGYCEELPEDVQKGLLAGAASKAMGGYLEGLALTPGAGSWKEDDVDEKFDASLISAARSNSASLSGQYNRIIANYAKVVI